MTMTPKPAAQEPRACPCLHTTPCSPACTCRNPVSSYGCRWCCTYGSAEQQREKAELLANMHSPAPPPDAELRAWLEKERERANMSGDDSDAEWIRFEMLAPEHHDALVALIRDAIAATGKVRT